MKDEPITNELLIEVLENGMKVLEKAFLAQYENRTYEIPEETIKLVILYYDQYKKLKEQKRQLNNVVIPTSVGV